MEDAKAEVLRYLGYRGQELSATVSDLVDTCMAEIRTAAHPRHIWRVFPLRPDAEGLALTQTDLILSGCDIRAHLSGCTRAALMAVTLGIAADRYIDSRKRTDLTAALILDACATQHVEEVCDRVQEEIAQDAAGEGLTVTARFSPGYGDLPLAIQPQVLRILDTERKIGLTCTERQLLLPRKSVTAVIGLGTHLPNDAPAHGKCDTCAKRENCAFRRSGNEGDNKS
ncbi:MAG: methionine synthase [Oscillospiraceae bacterium]|nr:methionine synthase [Oscillospiraceae bacterium]